MGKKDILFNDFPVYILELDQFWQRYNITIMHQHPLFFRYTTSLLENIEHSNPKNINKNPNEHNNMPIIVEFIFMLSPVLRIFLDFVLYITSWNSYNFLHTLVYVWLYDFSLFYNQNMNPTKCLKCPKD